MGLRTHCHSDTYAHAQAAYRNADAHAQAAYRHTYAHTEAAHSYTDAYAAAAYRNADAHAQATYRHLYAHAYAAPGCDRCAERVAEHDRPLWLHRRGCGRRTFGHAYAFRREQRSEQVRVPRAHVRRRQRAKACEHPSMGLHARDGHGEVESLVQQRRAGDGHDHDPGGHGYARPDGDTDSHAYSHAYAYPHAHAHADSRLRDLAGNDIGQRDAQRELEERLRVGAPDGLRRPLRSLLQLCGGRIDGRAHRSYLVEGRVPLPAVGH